MYEYNFRITQYFGLKAYVCVSLIESSTPKELAQTNKYVHFFRWWIIDEIPIRDGCVRIRFLWLIFNKKNWGEKLWMIRIMSDEL